MSIDQHFSSDLIIEDYIGFLISLDARKAFDSCDHNFIIRVFNKFEVCDGFTNIFKLLYNDLTSRVLLNGYFTDTFEIQCAAKQNSYALHFCKWEVWAIPMPLMLTIS